MGITILNNYRKVFPTYFKTPKDSFLQPSVLVFFNIAFNMQKNVCHVLLRSPFSPEGLGCVATDGQRNGWTERRASISARPMTGNQVMKPSKTSHGFCVVNFIALYKSSEIRTTIEFRCDRFDLLNRASGVKLKQISRTLNSQF